MRIRLKLNPTPSHSGDPTNITIYLTTYTGNAVSNNLYGLTWPTSDGSVYMHFEDQPPFGYSPLLFSNTVT